MTQPNHFSVEGLKPLTNAEIEEIRRDANNAYADEPATWTDVLCLILTIDRLKTEIVSLNQELFEIEMGEDL